MQKRYAYAYDPAGNRTVEQIDDAVAGFTYNNMNELVSQQPTGAMILEGTVSEPATVTVAGKPATVAPDNRFRGTAPVVSGTNTVTIVATDPSINATTRQYQVSNAGANKNFTFDANGNLTSDGSRTFEWDARNQLVAVAFGTHRSEFTYDGQQRRVRVVEKESSVVQTDTKVLWCEIGVCEERDSSGTVTRTISETGEVVSSAPRFFALDHLGSADAVLDSSGTLIARYAFDPWGRRTIAQGQLSIDRGFAGQVWQDASQLSLTRYRAFDPELGRWLSEDPLVTRQATPDRLLFMPNHFGAIASCVWAWQEQAWVRKSDWRRCRRP